MKLRVLTADAPNPYPDAVDVTANAATADEKECVTLGTPREIRGARNGMLGKKMKSVKSR